MAEQITPAARKTKELPVNFQYEVVRRKEDGEGD